MTATSLSTSAVMFMLLWPASAQVKSGVEDLPKSASDFVAARLDAKLALLAQMQLGRDELPPQSTQILAQALQDTTPAVRKAACQLITGRGFEARMSFAEGSEAMKRWMRERAALLTLSDRIISMIAGDEDETVRQAAVVAAVNLDYEGGAKRNVGLIMNKRLAETLAIAYIGEPDSLVRAEIIKSLSFGDSTSSGHDEMLLRSLADPSPAVVRFGLSGVARRMGPQAAPRIVVLLKHEDAGVRRSAADALHGLGPAAAAIANDVALAANVEMDAAARTAMLAALKSLRKEKS